MEKLCRKCASKASPRPLLNSVIDPKQPLHAKNFFKIRYFERELSKSLKKN